MIRSGNRVSGNNPSETVRKVPTGSKLKPQKSTKRSKKPYFAAVGSQNGGSSGYSKPFSDSLSRQFVNNPWNYAFLGNPKLIGCYFCLKQDFDWLVIPLAGTVV